MDNEGEVRLGLSVDLASIQKSINSAAESISTKFTSFYRKASTTSKQTTSKAGAEVKASVKEVEKTVDAASKKVENNVGEIGKSVNNASNKVKKDFGGALNSVQGIFKKLALATAAAFSVKAIADFGKECLDLGSDLQEVQNVVDVSFPTMSEQINNFARNAAKSFGLSETMAKQFTGTFGSMASAFGFSEKEAASMATTLTGLAGDVASFYNMSQDEAYTKLKSVFTGETESLKDLGVVMTQTALDSYALANGFGKATKDMSEMEKVALRYAFVQDQLSNASGDFLRTSGSWANQVKILSLQMDSLKASIGQGLINLFTPAIKVINETIARLLTLTDAFKQFTQTITGASSGGVDKVASGAASAAEGLENAQDAAEGLGSATTAAGKAAEKAAKKMYGLMGFDELNNHTSSDSSGDSDSSGTTIPSTGIENLSSGNTAVDTLTDKFKKLKDTVTELASLFTAGFQLGLGDLSVFDSIKKSINSIKTSFQNIISDEGLQAAVTNWAASLVTNFGKITGSITSIGLTIADNLLGGISIYLAEHKGDIQKSLTNLFNIQAQTAEIVGNYSVVVAEIAGVFRSDKAKQITANIINIFADSALNIAELGAKIGRDVINAITKPITENKDKIKNAISGTLDPVNTVIESISTCVSDTWDKIQSVYDTSISPLLDSLSSGVSEIVSTILDGYDKHIKPVLDKLSKKFKEVMENHIQPAIDSAVEGFGDFSDTVKTLWEKWLQPFVNWVAQNIMPLFAVVIENAGNRVIEVVESISDGIKGVSTAFSGVCNIIKGIADGDWKTIWSGIKKTASGVGEVIKSKFKLAWTGIKNIFTPAGEFFKGIWKAIKAAFNMTNEFFKTRFSGAYSKITGAFSNIKEFFKNVWTDIKKPFGSVAEWFETKFSNAWKKVKDVFSEDGKVFDGIKEGISSTFKTTVNALITGINKLIKDPFDSINNMLNKIRNTEVLGKKPFSGLWEENPLVYPQIPKLAQGGYVKANTPQLAMIGDNRHHGEIVAPEDKLQKMGDETAAKTASALIPVIERLCNAIIELEEKDKTQVVLEAVSDTGLYRIVKKEEEKDRKRKN